MVYVLYVISVPTIKALRLLSSAILDNFMIVKISLTAWIRQDISLRNSTAWISSNILILYNYA
jgi:hypothetical protein